MMHRLESGAERMNAAVVIVPVLLAVALLAPAASRAEPYLAVRSGQKCMACHVNPTGGGKRTEFGAIYGQTNLPAGRLDLATGKSVSATGAGSDPAPWTGKLNDHFAVGSDLRATLRNTDIPNSSGTQAFDQTAAQVYLEVKPIVDRLTVYFDERIAPGATTNRETFAMLWSANRTAYLKAGRMFLPFGLRIEDDTAFIRQVSGTTFSSSDDGVEGGLELGPWSAHLAVTNGAGGGAEADRAKQVSGLVGFVQPGWRVGLSASSNFGALDRHMQNAFAGLRTGIVSWIASGIYINAEERPTPTAPPVKRKQWATLIEGNIEAAKGHNVKLTYEYHDPNDDVRENERERYSAIWEYAPFQFTQFRLGVRKNDGIPQDNAQNATEIFLQWHAYF